jgi:hypothetical protein
MEKAVKIRTLKSDSRTDSLPSTFEMREDATTQGVSKGVTPKFA